jgi:HKD family nuclease
LILQPFEDDLSLYEALDQALADETMTQFTAIVAWAKESGLRRIEPSLKAFRDRGGTASIFLGIDEGGATIEGLQAAIRDFDEALVLFDAASGTFHPKVYIFDGEASSIVIITSNNMTAGGLFANYEAGTCLVLDLTEDADAQIHQAVTQYAQRLRDDETSLPLTEELIYQLVTDPRFDIRYEASQERTHGDSHGVSTRLGGPSLFGRSRYAKKRDPVPSRGRRIVRRPRVEEAGGSTSIEGGSTAAVVARWNKQLPRSDAGRPRAGSQTTAALRFTKARHPIDQTRWFREDLFGNEQWEPDPTRAGREITTARFDVTIDGIPRGTHELQLKHGAERESNERNFTTDLKWGSLTPVLRSEDLVGKWVTIEKLSDGSLRLIIADAPVGDFISLSARVGLWVVQLEKPRPVPSHPVRSIRRCNSARRASRSVPSSSGVSSGTASMSRASVRSISSSESEPAIMAISFK